jgi:Zn-dependent metalloprotease
MCQPEYADHPRNPLHCIVPPFILERLAESPNARVRARALQNMQIAAYMRGVRSMTTVLPASALRTASEIVGPAKVNREIYTQGGQDPPDSNLPGTLVRAEGQAKSSDPAVNEAYDYSGATWSFYWKIFGRNSLDNAGLKLISSVHVGTGYDNAFWSGTQMAYGDGDGVVFRRFTRAVDVVGHELTHGVVQYTSGLAYQGEAGALNEHFADVFGVMVAQFKKKQSVTKADWLVGKDILVPAATRRALRSLKAPGTAFQNDPDLGDDPQPDHYRKRYTGAQDHGGVHINSGIPNRAFYLAAIAAGGNAWKTVGPVWYQVMQNLLPTGQFSDFAGQIRAVGTSYANGKYSKILNNALRQVGL